MDRIGVNEGVISAAAATTTVDFRISQMREKTNFKDQGMFGRRDSFGANLKCKPQPPLPLLMLINFIANLLLSLVRGVNPIQPAPGAYNIPSIFDKKKKSNASFSNSPRNLSNNNSFYGKPETLKFPGPGAYFNLQQHSASTLDSTPFLMLP